MGDVQEPPSKPPLNVHSLLSAATLGGLAICFRWRGCPVNIREPPGWGLSTAETPSLEKAPANKHAGWVEPCLMLAS